MASKVLVRLAKQAAKAAAEARAANNAWTEAFSEEYGHTDISDDLVEIIDYGRGDISDLTAEFIDEHSRPDEPLTPNEPAKGRAESASSD